MAAHGQPANGGSGTGDQAISGDGQFVVFTSGAGNLVAGDTNGAADVFVRDRKLGVTTLVSVGAHGEPGNADSGQDGGPEISTDGRYVTFFSVATNLVPGGSSGVGDIFVRDLQAGTTELVSVGLGGAAANDHSDTPAISAHGRYVTFGSYATNLVRADYPQFSENVFLRDRKLGTTELVSVGPKGKPGDGFSDSPSVSANGRYVAFGSDGTNLVRGATEFLDEIYVRDRKLGTTSLVSVLPNGQPADLSSYFPSISADGRRVAFNSEADLVAGATNDSKNVFVRDLVAGTTALVSVGPKGRQADGQSGDDGLAISPDGLTVAFTSTATNLVPGVIGGVEQIYARGR